VIARRCAGKAEFMAQDIEILTTSVAGISESRGCPS